MQVTLTPFAGHPIRCSSYVMPVQQLNTHTTAIHVAATRLAVQSASRQTPCTALKAMSCKLAAKIRLPPLKPQCSSKALTECQNNLEDAHSD
eukprot:4830148-Amphidinium_carterae.1